MTQAGSASEIGSSTWRIPFFNGRFSFEAQWPALVRHVSRVFDHAKFSNGVLTTELEEGVKEYTGAGYAVGVNSETDALTLILRAIGIGQGDEVIVPAFASCVAASAVRHAGATPVFVDVEPGSYTMAPDAARAALTDRTRAIMPVHLFAQMADMTALRAIAGAAGLLVVEDSADAIGMRYRGVHAGLLGSAGVLSFSPTKTLGALGDAGMVITDDALLANRCARLRHHGRIAETAGWASDISSTAELVGINSKMDEIQAAILLAGLPHLDEAISRRSGLAARYAECLAEVDEIRTPVLPREESTDQVWYQYVIEAERRDDLASYLTQARIETETCHQNGTKADHPVAAAVAERTLSLPIYPDLSFPDVEYVCHTIEQFYNWNQT